MSGSSGKEPRAVEVDLSTAGTLVSRTSAPPAHHPPRTRELPVPATIGRYQVERLLGQGGMGRVWLARDTVLGRNVAIKVLRDDLQLPPPVHDELVTRMEHEARAAAAVGHPNIVVLHDMGEDETLGLFLVFEYVTTRDAGSSEDIVLSLRDRLKRGSLGFSEIAKLAREVGSALSFAHEAGVIHRDVKPENILFSRTGFKIADFGIARIPDSTITRTNTVLGTPAYTAPEALSKGEFSPASDQFSLAATLYEAAAGARAFAAEDPIATAGKVSSEPPPPLEEMLGEDVVVRALDEALQRGLAKTPEERFASCAELGEAVARVIERAEAETPRINVRLTPVPPLGRAVIEVERTPLSSRASIERISWPRGQTPPPTPSLRQRRQTQRFQNIAAGLAIVVIIVLVLLGRRSPGGESTVPSASASAAPPVTIAPPSSLPRRRVRPHPSATPRPSGEPTDAAALPVDGDD